MANEKLKSQIKSLEKKLWELDSENKSLKSELGSVVSSLYESENELARYNQYMENTLDNAKNIIIDSRNLSLKTYEIQGEIDKLYTRYKSVELANKKIRKLNNKKYYEFNNYRTVRKIVLGMMDNFDLTMISDRVIYKAVEKQHLVTPDFWLTCALLAIMGWKSDDKKLSERAIETSMKLDKKNTSLFFIVFNLRMDRDEAALKWFLEYQKCDLKSSDENNFLMMFSLISKTLNENVEEKTANVVTDYINTIIKECAEKEGYRESDIVDYVEYKMKSLVKNKTYDYPYLSKYCKEYEEISRMLNYALNNYNILEFILKITNVSIEERNCYLKEYINQLVAKPNKEEIKVYEDIEYNEMIIKMNGESEKAKEIIDTEKENNKKELNIIYTIIKWVYDFDNENISEQMRYNMFTLVKAIQQKATETYFASYRNLYADSREVVINDYSSIMNFSNELDEHNKVKEFYSEKKRKELAEASNVGVYIIFLLGLGFIVAAYYVDLLFFIGFGWGWEIKSYTGDGLQHFPVLGEPSLANFIFIFTIFRK